MEPIHWHEVDTTLITLGDALVDDRYEVTERMLSTPIYYNKSPPSVSPRLKILLPHVTGFRQDPGYNLMCIADFDASSRYVSGFLLLIEQIGLTMSDRSTCYWYNTSDDTVSLYVGIAEGSTANMVPHIEVVDHYVTDIVNVVNVVLYGLVSYPMCVREASDIKVYTLIVSRYKIMSTCECGYFHPLRVKLPTSILSSAVDGMTCKLRVEGGGKDVEEFIAAMAYIYMVRCHTHPPVSGMGDDTVITFDLPAEDRGNGTYVEFTRQDDITGPRMLLHGFTADV